MPTLLPIDVRKSHENRQNDKTSTHRPTNFTGNGSKLPPKPSQAPLQAMRSEVDRDKNDIGAWERLLKALEDSYKSQNETGALDDTLGLDLDETYTALLERFPYLTVQWKNYSVFKFQFQGIDASIAALAQSVENHPTSVELWTEYLTAMTTQDPEYNDAPRLRNLFSKAIDIVGHHFNSDPIWDMYIAFEAKVSGPESEAVISVYSKVTHIPLYKYAIYFEHYSTINKGAQLHQICPKNAIDQYLQKFEKSSPDQLTEAETSQIIDDYCYKVFTNIQELVGEFWAFESQIESFDYNGKTVPKEKSIWKEYQEYAISKFQSEPSEVNYSVCVSIFERALVPNCDDGHFWLKYISFLNSSNFHIEATRTKIEHAYNRANNTFVPVTETATRTSYIYYLMSLDERSNALDHLLDMIETLAGPDLYLKQQYLVYVELFVGILTELSSDFVSTSKILITNFFEDDHKRASLPEGEYSDKLNQLFQLLNNDSICVVVFSYLRHVEKMYKNDMEIASETLRTFFNQYYRQPALSRSTRFWHFYVEFEGVVMKDMVNLRNIINYIKSYSQLPQTCIDALADQVYDIASGNLPVVVREELQDDLLLSVKNSSRSIIMDHKLRSRLAHNSFIVQDMEERKEKNGNQYELLKLLRKHANHPGILVDAQPSITNEIAIEEIDIPQAGVPDLPTFRNVEKTNTPIRYPEY
ncbi:Pre-mRNA-processing factor 39 [Meyerozyma sp. JA9]|nr:Pre-mRNA-processing factor 39 [Meyerozyma sp. JA9]